MATAINIRQRIIDAVRTRLQSILVANGFNFSLGNNIHEWRDTPFSSDALPALVYRDISCEIIQAEGHRCNLRIEVELVAGLATSASAGASDIRKMIADIYSAIRQDIHWGTLALDTLPEGDEMRVEQAEQKVSGAVVRFSIVYRTREWNPYQRLT